MLTNIFFSLPFNNFRLEQVLLMQVTVWGLHRDEIFTMDFCYFTNLYYWLSCSCGNGKAVTLGPAFRKIELIYSRARWADQLTRALFLSVWEGSFAAPGAPPASHQPAQPKGRRRPRWGWHSCWLSSLKLVPSRQLEAVKFSQKFWWKLPKR